MQDLPTQGLRERKREQTRQRLECAAVDIVLDEGLDKLTIDALSERADVSPRTFFNYFDSKEDAILGLPTQDDAERLVADAVADIHPETIVDGILALLTRVMTGVVRDGELHRRRHEVLRTHPELMQRKFAHMNRLLVPLTAGIHTLRARTGATEACTDGQVQVMLAMCGSALRAAAAELGRTPADLNTDESTALLRTRAAALVREAMEAMR